MVPILADAWSLDVVREKVAAVTSVFIDDSTRVSVRFSDGACHNVALRTETESAVRKFHDSVARVRSPDVVHPEDLVALIRGRADIRPRSDASITADGATGMITSLRDLLSAIDGVTRAFNPRVGSTSCGSSTTSEIVCTESTTFGSPDVLVSDGLSIGRRQWPRLWAPIGRKSIIE